MRKRHVLLLALLLGITGCGSNTALQNNESDSVQEITIQEQETEDKDEVESNSLDEQESSDPLSFLQMQIIDENSLRECMDAAWNAYVMRELANDKRISEVDNRAMDYGEVTMKYGLQKKGEPGPNGYPVYIALHGGGQSDTPTINDQQWAAMATYYGTNVKNGIYINPRGVRDTWNCHFNDESFILYDELIENMILFYNADPNRIYLMGYSAGGDGVYAISPRMADRFAAVNMSAGHPNGVNLLNLSNVPIALQVGIFDDAYDRNKVTAEYGIKLDELQTEYGEDYFKHVTWVHGGYAHNFIDYKISEQDVVADYKAWLEVGDDTMIPVNTNAVEFLTQYERNPLPELITWDLGTRAPLRDNDCFYWLKADSSVIEGTIEASYSKADNSITISKADISEESDFEILISPDMVDVFKPIIINCPEESIEYTISDINPDTIWNTTLERGDKSYQFVATIHYKDIKKK